MWFTVYAVDNSQMSHMRRSENKRICVLMKHLLSGESYELTQAKVFDMLWSSIEKGQSETLARASTMGLQQGCTPKEPP